MCVYHDDVHERTADMDVDVQEDGEKEDGQSEEVRLNRTSPATTVINTGAHSTLHIYL